MPVESAPIMRISWDPWDPEQAYPEEQTLDAVSPADLVEKLDGLHDQFRQAATPTLVVLAPPGSPATLGVGLGRDEGVLSWIDPEGGEDLYSLGEAAAADDADVEFLYAGEGSYFPLSALVPLADLREAARLFMETGARPSNIPWQETP